MAAPTGSEYGFGWAATKQQALVAPHAEYYRKNRWLIEFVLPAAFGGAAADAANVLRVHLSTAARPNISFEETEVHRINGKIYLAGKPSYEPLTVTFYDNLAFAGGPPGIDGTPEPLSVSNIIEAWRQTIYQPTQGDAFGAAPNYKGACLLHMLAPSTITGDPAGEPDQPTVEDATTNSAQEWAYVGLYPSQINYGDLDYAASDVQMVEVTFRYDRAYLVQ